MGGCLQLSNSACFQLAADVEVNFDWPDHDYWILSRELTIYECLDFSDVPKRLRARALEKKVTTLSPFKDPGYYVEWTDSFAQVYLWDEALRQRTLDELIESHASHAEHIRRLKPVPEPLFFNTRVEGKVCVECVAGVDAQVWQGARLVASKWLPEPDDAAAKVLVPTPGPVRGSDENSDITEQVWWRLVAFVLLVALFFEFGSWAGLRVTVSQMTQEVSEGRKGLASLLALKNQAEAVRKDNEKLTAWVTPPRQISLLAQVDRLLPDTVKITAWNYQNSELNLTISDENLDNRAYVEALSKAETFESVSVEPGSQNESAIVRLQVVQ